MIRSPFDDLADYVKLPRNGPPRLSPDGRRVVYSVAVPDEKKNRYVTSLWEVDAGGEGPARRLTWGAEGEADPAWTPDGDLLFTAKRPTATDKSSLWLLPSGGGEARQVVAPSGGIDDIRVSASGTIVITSPLLPSATDPEHDRQVRERRDDAGITAILHEEYPIRAWDRHIGPDRRRFLVVDGDRLRDLTGHVGPALDSNETGWDLSADGSTIVAGWLVAEDPASQRSTLVTIDVATGERRVLADNPDFEYLSPAISPDGAYVAVVVLQRCSPGDVFDRRLAVIPIAGGEVRLLAAEWDRWPRDPLWTADGQSLVIGADDNGRAPLWRVDVETGQVTRLTPDDGAYTDVRLSRDGQWAYALRSAVDSPPSPVRVALDGSTMELLVGPAYEVPGRLEEVTTTAADGTTIRAWIALPQSQEPAPLLLWIHGGPYMTWNAWMWRWNPWLAVARGYAVLLPDPALSSGYGTEFIRRGWANWGGAPYTDLMSLTDAALRRPDLDASRTAAMGGSFGGYMANWVAGHTDRFDAIVTHASLWAMDQMMSTTDMAFDFVREMTEADADANSPHRSVDAITTPMLVIHGDKDYRVPVGESLRLWWELSARAKAGDNPHKFLYFPDENHWILKPNHTKVWYSTVFAFLAHHVLGQDWQRPENLG
ncbi:prolyl oligopeptidase family serine peptidase [Kibdelosporangium phytohabitans]|uniref:Peptidase S9 n=1 Tax=Kibdelosporangium phytohabitans TaxID=860235 RepID=A0A0N9IBW2_9PSEU|nr:S9 family peptidase [Kibdelosporangium phytohabitans]ALG13760.1 peptidase S9 [Kibdelosporangium phytohabitans]MBE1467328.1 dipeptidyl aminopeptidase/acylaminoacyl peptidase [Kibdelosporangium phytohabitans]